MVRIFGFSAECDLERCEFFFVFALVIIDADGVGWNLDIMSEINAEDLINFNSGSPFLSRSPQNAELHQPEVVNLIDQELPTFEAKLNENPQNSSPELRPTKIDIEDILITIEDTDHVENGVRSRAESLEHLEVLNVLKDFDEVLNSCLEAEENEDANKVQECLMELDKYLQGFEVDEDLERHFILQIEPEESDAAIVVGTPPTDKNHTYVDKKDLEVVPPGENCNGGVFEGLEETSTVDAILETLQNFEATSSMCKSSNENEEKLDVGLLEKTNICDIIIQKLDESLNKEHSEEVDQNSVSAISEDNSERNDCQNVVEATQKLEETSSEDYEEESLQDLQQITPTNELSGESLQNSEGTISGEACWEDTSQNPDETSSYDDLEDDSSHHLENIFCGDDPNGEASLRKHLEKFEANYSKFLSSTSSQQLPRSSSTTTLPSIQRCDRLRATVTSTTPCRTSGAEEPGVWPHSSNCCTGSVVVEATPKDVRLSMRRLQPLGESSVGLRPVSAPSSVRTSTRSNGVGARSSSASSRRHSLDSSVTSLESVESNVQEEVVQNPLPSRRPCDRSSSEMPPTESPLGQWPHSLSSMMACLGCTLGLFNVCRFGILTVHFGANFIFQFVLLSLVLGLPLYTLQLCLGQQLGAGVVDMWRISPLFQGVGIALLLSHMLIGLYSIVGVSWMFVFFRDSFITRLDKYRWAEPFLYYREALHNSNNGTYKLSETIPDYFNGVVLQRHHLPDGAYYGTIKFQVAFNLAVVWMIVFVSLSKGLRSYGKVVYVFTLLPIFGTFVLCAKILGMMPPEYINIIFPESTWNEFFLNPKSWLAAAQEVFLTWGLLGAAVMQIASHNKNKHLLQRDSSLVALITFTILLLVAFLANTCVQILKSFGYNYLPNSYEHMSSYTFLRASNDPLPPSLASWPLKYMPHNSFIIGEKVVRPGVDASIESGYQALRLATELIPATFAVLGSEQLSPFWSVLFYFILILFGIGQQLAIWHTVITGVMAIKAKYLKSWETTITLFSCIFGYLFGLPMATEFGIYVVYFLDYTIGGIWWIVVIILLEIVAVFMVRGRPYSGDTVVTALFTSNNSPCLLSWAPALLSFTWNVILPVALAALCISTFKNGHFRDIFVWHHAPSAEYWPLWARQVGSMLQLVPILLVPLVAVIQSYRYLNNGPSDILERIQLLYRPPIGEHMTDITVQETTNQTPTSAAAINPTNEDPPPKYTPPPSYTTATGARLAKFLRHSIRRSVRRILGESSRANTQNPPPDYNAVLVEMNHHQEPRVSTLERLRHLQATPGSPTLTAAEVASILRSSFRRSTNRRGRVSRENLVEGAVPVGETSLAEDDAK